MELAIIGIAVLLGLLVRSVLARRNRQAHPSGPPVPEIDVPEWLPRDPWIFEPDRLARRPGSGVWIYTFGLHVELPHGLIWFRELSRAGRAAARRFGEPVSVLVAASPPSDDVAAYEVDIDAVAHGTVYVPDTKAAVPGALSDGCERVMHTLTSAAVIKAQLGHLRPLDTGIVAPFVMTVGYDGTSVVTRGEIVFTSESSFEATSSWMIAADSRNAFLILHFPVRLRHALTQALFDAWGRVR